MMVGYSMFNLGSVCSDEVKGRGIELEVFWIDGVRDERFDDCFILDDHV